MGVTVIRALLVAGRHLGPQALALVAAVRKGPRHADGADGVQLVGIVKDLGLQGLGCGPGAESMGGDGMGHGLHLVRRVTSQELAGKLGAGLGMVGRQPVAPATGRIVEQCGGAHNLQIGPFGLCQLFGQGQYPQDVIKVMNGFGAGVLCACCF